LAYLFSTWKEDDKVPKPQLIKQTKGSGGFCLLLGLNVVDVAPAAIAKLQLRQGAF
jgi:hypothetical protein